MSGSTVCIAPDYDRVEKYLSRVFYWRKTNCIVFHSGGSIWSNSQKKISSSIKQTPANEGWKEVTNSKQLNKQNQTKTPKKQKTKHNKKQWPKKRKEVHRSMEAQGNSVAFLPLKLAVQIHCRKATVYLQSCFARTLALYWYLNFYIKLKPIRLTINLANILDEKNFSFRIFFLLSTANIHITFQKLQVKANLVFH